MVCVNAICIVVHSRAFWSIFTFLHYVTSSVTWPFDSPHPTYYRCSTGTDTLSPRDFKILRLKCIWVTVLTFLGHVTSSVTWPFDSQYPTSYRCSIGTDTLSPRDFEILRLKCIWVTVLTFLGQSDSEWLLCSVRSFPQRWSHGALQKLTHCVVSTSWFLLKT